MFLNAHVTNRALLCVDFGFVGCEVIIEKLFREMEKKIRNGVFLIFENIILVLKQRRATSWKEITDFIKGKGFNLIRTFKYHVAGNVITTFWFRMTSPPPLIYILFEIRISDSHCIYLHILFHVTPSSAKHLFLRLCCASCRLNFQDSSGFSLVLQQSRSKSRW